MIREVATMGASIGFRALLIVCLDADCTQRACSEKSKQKLLHILHYEPPPITHSGQRRATVAEAKFGLAHALAKHVAKASAEGNWKDPGHFTFFEMDVWFTQTPLPLFHEANAPLLLGSHQDNPQYANIGTYHCAATSKMAVFWGTMLAYMRANPGEISTY